MAKYRGCDRCGWLSQGCVFFVCVCFGGGKCNGAIWVWYSVKHHKGLFIHTKKTRLGKGIVWDGEVWMGKVRFTVCFAKRGCFWWNSLRRFAYAFTNFTTTRLHNSVNIHNPHCKIFRSLSFQTTSRRAVEYLLRRLKWGLIKEGYVNVSGKWINSKKPTLCSSRNVLVCLWQR